MKLCQSVMIFYSFNVIPKIGKYVAKDEEAYLYLVNSIREFPKQDEFSGIMSKAGFFNVRYSDLAFGAVAIYTGWAV